MFTRVAHLCFISQFFKKVALAGLPSLRQKEYQILVKNWIFDDRGCLVSKYTGLNIKRGIVQKVYE